MEQNQQTILAAVAAGDMPRAVRAAQDILERAGRLDGYLLLAQTLLQSGRAAEACQYYAVLRDTLPAHAGIAFGYGLALQQAGRPQEAILQWQAALALDPAAADACQNIAMGLIEAGRDGEAAEFLHRLLALRPGDARALFHLGNIAFRQGALDEASLRYEGALAADPALADARINLAEIARTQGLAAAAEGHLRQVLAGSPASMAAHFNLAGLLLGKGAWQEGFAHFEWRSNLKSLPPALVGLPAWTPAAPPGSPVALWNDQGMGDALMFLRYAERLTALGYRTMAILQRPLIRLAASCAGLAGPVVGVDAEMGEAPAFQLPLASLPHRLGDPDPTRSWPGPYLRVPPAAIAAAGHRRLVGLVWSANVNNRTGPSRNIGLEALAPLADLPGIGWHALQVGPAVAEIAPSSWAGRIVEHAATLGDLYDTAALVAALDLVITVDTVVAHLAGALGKPVWILLPRPFDWKWQDDGASSYWYPSARLFRQARPGDWQGVVTDLLAALAERA